MPRKVDNTQDKYCVIGTGASGLAAVKNLRALGIPCDAYEAHSDIGGIWDIKNPNSTVYETTYTITSKTVTAYADFPMPQHYPVYQHHSLVLEYLRSYADHFGLRENIRFSTRVTSVKRADGAGWSVTIADPSGTRTLPYRGVIIANGHNWSPNVPSYPGSFSGQVMHSKDYKRPDGFEGKRVLVVGSGNTGCDICVDSARLAKTTMLSARRGYHYLPKFLLGLPSDSLGKSSQSSSPPIWVIRAVFKALLWMAVGKQTSYGLPEPDHAFLETPPIVNTLIPYYVAHGAIRMKPDVARLDGERVHFADGSSEQIDIIVYATGYKPDFPFIERRHLAWQGERPSPYLFLFHPEYDDLFFAGLTDGTGGHFPTVDAGTQLIARYLWCLDNDPQTARAFSAQRKGAPPDLGQGIRFINTPRNYTQFELHYYLKLLQNRIAELGKNIPNQVLHGQPTRRERPAISASAAPSHSAESV